jgi:hypothetical protein
VVSILEWEMAWKLLVWLTTTLPRRLWSRVFNCLIRFRYRFGSFIFPSKPRKVD